MYQDILKRKSYLGTHQYFKTFLKYILYSWYVYRILFKGRLIFMSFSFAGNKFNYRKNSDDYTDNSTRISTSTTSNVNITNTYNDTYHIDLKGVEKEAERKAEEMVEKQIEAGYYDKYDEGDLVLETREEWLDYIRRVLYNVKNTIVEHEKRGCKLENIHYVDPDCTILEVTFISEDGRLDKEVITYNELY